MVKIERSWFTTGCYNLLKENAVSCSLLASAQIHHEIQNSEFLVRYLRSKSVRWLQRTFGYLVVTCESQSAIGLINSLSYGAWLDWLPSGMQRAPVALGNWQLMFTIRISGKHQSRIQKKMNKIIIFRFSAYSHFPSSLVIAMCLFVLARWLIVQVQCFPQILGYTIYREHSISPQLFPRVSIEVSIEVSWSVCVLGTWRIHDMSLESCRHLFEEFCLPKIGWEQFIGNSFLFPGIVKQSNNKV